MEQKQGSGLRRAMSTAILTTRLRLSVFALSRVSVVLYGGDLFYLSGRNYENSSHFAPVVSLGSGVQIKSGEGTTEKPYVIGK